MDSGPAETTRHGHVAHIRPWKCRAIVPVNQTLKWLSQEFVQISQLKRSQLFLLQNSIIYTYPMGRYGNHSMKSYKAADYLSSHQDFSPLSLPVPPTIPSPDSTGPGVPSHTLLAPIPSQILPLALRLPATDLALLTQVPGPGSQLTLPGQVQGDSLLHWPGYLSPP